MQRKVLVPVIAAQVVALLGLGGLILNQVNANPGSEPQLGVELVEAGAVSGNSSTQDVSTTTEAGTSAATPAPGTQPTVPGQPFVQNGQPSTTAVPVQPQEPTGAPGNLSTTTPPITTTTTPSTPWCYVEGQGWFSGGNAGCYPDSPHFVEYR